MVDLVKIRKKAKKKGEGAPDDEQTAKSGEASSEAPSSAAEVPPAVDDHARNEPAPAPHEQTPREESSETRQSVIEPSSPTPAAEPAGTSKLERFKQQAGKRRVTESLAAAEEEEAESADLELLTFVVAGEQYAVEIERIVEIVTPRARTRIPNADSSVLGITSLRGTIVTLVDVRRRLRHPAAAALTADTRIVVVDFHNEIVGFVVDRVLRVVKTPPGDVQPPPVVRVDELDESIRGVFRVNDALTILLDLDKLLDSRTLAATTA